MPTGAMLVMSIRAVVKNIGWIFFKVSSYQILIEDTIASFKNIITKPINRFRS